EVSGPLTPTEAAVRDEVEYWADTIAADLQERFTHRCAQQLRLGGPQAWDGTTDPFFLWPAAIQRHVFCNATVEELPTGLRYSAAIRVDTGTPPVNGYCCGTETPPFVEPQYDTHQTNPPVFELTVELSDQDANGSWEACNVSGSIGGVPLATALDQNPFAMHGHLLTPLRAIIHSDYWDPTLD
ncbi:MAG TPA: hypothetical protein VEI97_17680, partial [bacterium]|nr:hypothetical protein [bacterium]